MVARARMEGPSYGLVGEAMRSGTVRRALRAKADKLAQRVQTLGASEGVGMEPEVSEGTRPKGRPYARVSSTNVGQEWGDSWTERRRILGRVAEGE